MRGIARTAVLAATRDIADAPARPVRPRAQAAWARAAFLAAPTRSSVELGTDETRTGGDADGSGDAPGPGFLGLTSGSSGGLGEQVDARQARPLAVRLEQAAGVLRLGPAAEQRASRA